MGLFYDITAKMLPDFGPHNSEFNCVCVFWQTQRLYSIFYVYWISFPYYLNFYLRTKGVGDK